MNSLQLTQTLTVYRRSGPARTEGAAILSDLRCSPLYAADVQRLGQLQQLGLIKTVYSVFECFVDGLQDIRQGDEVEIDGARYIVRGVSKWGRLLGSVTQITVEGISR